MANFVWDVGMNSTNKSEVRTAWTLLLPAIVIFALIAFYPLVSVFYYSLTDKKFASDKPTEFIGLDNYSMMLSMEFYEIPPQKDDAGKVKLDENGDTLYEDPIDILPMDPVAYWEMYTFNIFGKRYTLAATDPEFLISIKDTVIFSVLAVALELIIGMAFALTLNSHFKGRGVMRMALLVPWAIPTVVSTKMWAWMFSSQGYGLFNTVAYYLGLSDHQIAFLVTPDWQLPIMVVIDVWKTMPFMALMLLAGLQTIPSDYYEAASIDGASKVRQFFNITLPLLKPAIVVALVFRMLDSLRVFDLFQVLFGSKFFSMSSYTYYKLIEGKEMGYSSACSVVIFIAILIFSLFFIRVLGREQINGK